MLPSGYTQVEYIKSNGSNYINTGYIPNSKTNIDIEFAYHSSLWNDSHTALFGVRETANVGQFALFMTTASPYVIETNYGSFDSGASADGLVYINLDEKYSFSNNGGKKYILFLYRLQSSIFFL